jgi:hypothetical protein
VTTKLTAAQARRLIEIADICLDPAKRHGFPAAGWGGTRTEKALKEKGLLRHWVEVRPLGGAGAVGLFKAEWQLCEPTHEGWLVTKEIDDVQ